jgi:hypothetical protein
VEYAGGKVRGTVLATFGRTSSDVMSTSSKPPPPPWTTTPTGRLDGGPRQPSGPARFVGLLVIAAVALSGIGGGIWFVFGQAERDDEGSIAAAGDLEVAELRIGDCFDDDPAWIDEEVFEVFAVEATPCGEPHDNEVFHRFDLAAEMLPSDDEVDDEAFETCVEVFKTFVGARYEDSELDFDWLWPSKDSWRAGDRSVTCYLYAMDLSKVEGSAAGTGR